MRLSCIQMTGFKSFRNTTTVRFGEGITGIVGPNGCGKSNIVDALLWAAGEGPASQIRGSQMEDIIFSGTSSSPPASFAEVHVTFEKDDGEWPKRFKPSELTITRRLSRGGDSKYFLNGKNCLLRDIQEIIMDTGAMGFSVVEQDTIAQITTSKPEQLRTLIEQAAGTAKFKNKKRLAQNKLKETCQNMLRLEDVLREHTKQLKRLEKQAQQTHIYKELKEKITCVELYILKMRYKEAAQKLEDQAGGLKKLSGQEEGCQKKLSSLQEESRNVRSQSEEKYSHLSKEREVLRQQLEELGQYEVKSAQLKSSIQSDSEKLDEWKMSILEHQASGRHQSQEIEKLKAQSEKYKNKTSALQADIEKKKAQLEKNKLQHSLIQKLKAENQAQRENQLKEELKEEEVLKSLQRDLEGSVEELKNLQKELKEREGVYQLLESRSLSLQKKIKSDQELCLKLGRDIDFLTAHIHSLVQKEKEILVQKTEVQKKEQERVRFLRAESQERSLSLRKNREELKLSGRKEEEEYKKCLENREKLKAFIDHAQLSLLSLQKDLKSCCAQRELLEKSIRDMSRKISDFSERSNKSNQRIEKNKLELAQVESLLEKKRHTYKEQVKADAVYEQDYTAQISHYRGLENQITELSQNLNHISEKKHLFEVEKEALLSEKKNLEEKALENYQTSLQDIRGEPPPPEAVKDIQLMKDRLSKIGQVNLLALSEYEELSAEQKDLQKQFNDLEVSKTELEQAIEEMDRVSTKKFKKAYEEVNARLTQVFKAVFGGGSANLSLTENGGVEILACPPEKKLKSLKLLSGGEKSLTALCVIFSLFLVRPAPFCILDEVDAALDDSNVLRFNTLAVEMAQRCQVILVTHNKHSMKECRRLYGVTMEEKGITNLLSVEMKDYETSLSL